MQDLRIGMVQMQCAVGDISGNIARMESFLKQSALNSVDIVCFPELSISGYNPGDLYNPQPEPIPSKITARLERLSRDYNMWFLSGILERGGDGVVYNTHVVCCPNGVVGIYRKTHVPTSEICTWSQGDMLPVFDHPKVKFGIEICYDSHFPEVTAMLADRGAEVIFMPHASGAVETASEKKKRWLKYIPARAYDNTLFVAVCNQVGDNANGIKFSGVTFVCGPKGEVIAKAKYTDRQEMVIADLKASVLEDARRVPEWFFRHFRRSNLGD